MVQLCRKGGKPIPTLNVDTFSPEAPETKPPARPLEATEKWRVKPKKWGEDQISTKMCLLLTNFAIYSAKVGGIGIHLLISQFFKFFQLIKLFQDFNWM